jgi:TPR repeat protein
MDGEEVRLKPDALAHLADALMEDIVAAPPHQLAIEEIVAAGRSRDLVFRFDDILAEAAASSTERPASRHGSAMWNLTDALCEDLVAQPDDAHPGDAADDRTGRGSLAAQFDDIIHRDSHLARAGLTLPARRHPTLSVKAVLATLRDRLVAPLHSRSAAGAFATVVTAAVLTAVVYQPSRWTVDDQPLPPAAEPERLAEALPESAAASAAPPAAARVESLPSPAPAHGGSAANMARPAEAPPPPAAVAADIGEKRVAAARMRAAAPPPPTASASPAIPAQPGVASQLDVASEVDASPPAAAAPPAIVSALAPARKQRVEADAAPGGRAAETARAASPRGRLDRPPALDIPGISVPPAIPLMTPGERSAWWTPMQSGDVETRLKALEDAARSGDVAAAWKLGRIYADGDGVQQDHLRAFGYFRRITEDHATSSAGDAGRPTARFVASAFAEVGRYYLAGIANSDIKPDPVRAFEMFTHAANNGDPDAQYHLGRLYLDGEGVAKAPMQGVRWLYQAAMKGQYHAQAMFGRLLFMGQVVPREAAKGLMWLKIAAVAAPAGETAITEIYDAAWKQATDEERAAAMVYFEEWHRRGRRVPQ